MLVHQVNETMLLMIPSIMPYRMNWMSMMPWMMPRMTPHHMTRMMIREMAHHMNRNMIREEEIQFDPGKRISIDEYPPNMKDMVRRKYLANGPCQPRTYEFPRR